MRKMILLALFVVSILCVNSVMALVVFTDNFESGNLDNWTIGGRRAGTNIANVVQCDNGSLGGHLYHRYFTEITMSRGIAFDPQLEIDFDLKVDVYSQTPPASNYYGLAGVSLGFSRADNTGMGSVWYIAATTNYPFSHGPGASPNTKVNQIPENVMTHYNIPVSDLLSQTSLSDTTDITNIGMTLITYSSTWPYPDVRCELWVDNVSFKTPDPIVSPAPVPEPSSMMLMVSGLLGLVGVGSRKFLLSGILKSI